MLATLGACTVGPDYVRPVADAPAKFKEADGWKTAQPRDQELRGKWWEAFNDPQLNAMMDQVSLTNQNLVQAAAQFRRDTKVFETGVQSGLTYLLTLDGMTGARAGIPLIEGGKLIGAIGCSGGTGSQDDCLLYTSPSPRD